MAEAGNLQLTGFASKKDEGFALDDRVNWTVWSDANDLANGSEYHLETNTAIASYTSSWFDATASYTQQKRDDDYRKDSWASGDTYDYTIDYRTPSVSAKLHHTFGKHSLKFGGEYTYGDAKAEWTYYGDPVIEKLHFQQDLAGLYAEDSWQVLEKLNFTLGVRYDYFKNKLTTEGADPNTDTEIDDDGFSPPGQPDLRPAQQLAGLRLRGPRVQGPDHGRPLPLVRQLRADQLRRPCRAAGLLRAATACRSAQEPDSPAVHRFLAVDDRPAQAGQGLGL